MKRSILILLVLLLSVGFVFTACNVVKGSGKIEKKEFDFSDFTKLNINNAFEVNITQSDRYSISITADSNILKDYLDVELSEDGEKVIIKLKTNYVYNVLDMTLKADIKMKTVAKLDLSGASKCQLLNGGFDQTETFSLDIEGASSLEGEVKSGNVDINMSGASKVSLTGSAPILFIDVSGASNLNLGGFEVQDAKVEASGASKMVLNVARKIQGSVKGASSLSYYGNALANVNSTGASSVKRIKK